MNETRAILDANERKNVTWVPKIEGISWETSDKKLQAINLFGRLQIATKNYAERMRVIHKNRIYVTRACASSRLAISFPGLSSRSEESETKAPNGTTSTFEAREVPRRVI